MEKMKQLLIGIGLVLLGQLALAQTTYYAQSTTNLNLVANWNSDPNGLGLPPNNFTDNDQIFLIDELGTASIAANWTVSGTGSKIVIGDGVNGLNFSTGAFTVTGLVDVSNLGVFTVQSNSSFTVGTLASGSTVDYALDNTQSVRAGVYHHLTLSNATASRTKTASGAVTVNGTLDIGTNNILAMTTFLLDGSLTSITGNGSITTTNTTTTPLPNGKTWTQSVTYSAATSGVASGTYENLTIATTGTKTAQGNITVNTTLSVTATLAMSTFELSGGFTTSGAGTITTNSTSATALPSGKTWAQTVQYNGAVAQTIAGGTYQNLQINGGSNVVKTAAANFGVITALTIATATILDMGTNAITTLGGTTFGNATTSIIRTQHTGPNPFPAPVNFGSAGLVVYNSASSQTVVHGLYTNINVSGGDRVYSATDSIRILGSWTLGNNAHDFTGTSIALRGAAQTITITGVTALTFNNLSVSVAGTKTFSNAGANITINGNLNLPTPTFVLALGTNRLLLGGGYTFNGNGALTTACTLTNPLPSGINWPFTVTYSATVNNEVAQGTYLNLSITGAGTATATGDIDVTNNLSVSSTGSIFALGTFRLLSVGGTISNTATISTAYTAGTDAFPTGRTWPGTVSYTAAANQQITDGTYANLSISGGSNAIKSAVADINVTTTLTVAASTILDLVTFQVTATTFTNAGTIRTQNTGLTPLPVGRTIAGTLEYNGASSQNVVGGTFTNLNLTGGDRVLSSTDTIKIAGTFTMGGGTFTSTGSIIALNGTTQTINGGGQTLGNLSITAGTVKTVAVNGFNIDERLHIAAGGTLAMATFNLGGTLNNISGTGSLSTSSVSVTPLPSNKTWTMTTVTYGGVAQTIVGGNYNNLTLGGSGTKTASGDINVALTLNAGALTFDMSTFQLSGITTLTATGILNTANTSATPIPVRTWTFATVNYNSALSQTVVGGQYVALNLTGGDRTLSPTDTIKISGTFTMGAGTYTPAGSVVALNGATTQTVNGGGQAFNDFAIILGTTKTVAVNGFTINGNLQIVSTATLAMATFELGGAGLTTSGSGNVSTTCTTANPLPGGRTWTMTTVTYGGTAQTIVGGTYNNNLVLSGSGTKTASGNIHVGGTLNTAALTFDMSSFQLTGITSLTATGILNTANTSATPIPVRTWTYATVNYNAASSQTVVGGQYVALNLTGGDRTLSPADSIKVSGTFTMGAGAYTSTGNTIALNGATTQSIVAGGQTFNNFAIIAGTIKTVSINGFNVDGELTINGGATLTMATFQLGGTLTSIAGSGTLSTSNTGATPIPSGKTWTQTVNYAAGSQTVVTGTYQNLTLTGNTTVKTASGDINIASNLTFAGNAATTLAMGTNQLLGIAGTSSGVGTITTAHTATATPIPAGKTWPQSVTYNAAGDQTVVDGTYNVALNAAGGNRTFSNAGNINVAGTFTANTGVAVYTTTGTTMVFTASVAQALTLAANFPFENVSFTGGNTKTPSASFSVASNINIAAGVTVNMGANALSGAALTTSGTGLLRTQSTSATPVPTGRTWTFRVQYDLTNNNQTVAAGTYSGGLSVSATSGLRNRTLGGSIIVGDTLSIGSTFTTLVLNGNTLTLNGIINPAQTGSITGSATSQLVVGPNADDAGTLTMNTSSTANRTLLNLTLNRNTGADALILGTELRLLNALTLSDGTLAANGNLVMLSTAPAVSAQVAPVTGTGNVSGNVVVQRFIDGAPIASSVRWRFVASSVNTSNGINNNWQQQIYITGPGTGGTLCPSITPNSNGFDPTTTNNSSFFYYDLGVNNWATIANTNATQLQTGVGYRVFYRGSRSQSCATIFSTTPPDPLDTTLVATGTLAIGSQVLNGATVAGRYALVGNPFQATIDLEAVSLSNLSSTVSSFRTNSVNGSYGYYTIGGIGTNGMTRYMSPGQSFWIQTSANGASSMTVPESAKAITEGGFAFYKNGPVAESQVLRVKLYKEGVTEYLDELALATRNNAEWAFNLAEDAAKMGFGVDQLQFSVPGSTQKCAISVVPGFDETHNRINLEARTTVNQTYTLDFSGITSFPSTTGFKLVDTYKNIEQDLNAAAAYSFNTPDAASTSLDRFYIQVSTTASSLPVVLTTFTGKVNDAKQSELFWATASEKGSSHFVVERSADGKSFESIGMVKSRGNSSTQNRYMFTDAAPVAGNNYYRLKSVDQDGSFAYSGMLLLSNSAKLLAGDVQIYPVPTTDILHVFIANREALAQPTFEIIDLFGKSVQAPVSGADGDWTIETSGLSSGIYFIRLTNAGLVSQFRFIKQ